MIKQEEIKKTERNGLIELYRFLFAMWIVYYHGYFVFKNQYFNNGYIAVEFFFILSGFYFLKTLDRYKEKPFFTGLWQMVWHRLKSLGLALFVGTIFVIWFMFLKGEMFFVGYFWYVPMLIVSFVLIYTLNRLIKNKNAFVLTLLTVVVVSYLILYIPIWEKVGLFRSLGGVSLGVLISFIPKLNLKLKNFNINYIFTALLFFITLYLAYLPKTNLISEYFLVFLLMPMLIYFTNNIDVKSGILNFLGSLSLRLYIYQCVICVIEFYFQLKPYCFFAILVLLVLIDKLISKLWNSVKSKRNC